VVGAPGMTGTIGSAFVFTTTNGWATATGAPLAATLQAGDQFGWSAAIAGSSGSYTIAVGAPDPFNNDTNKPGPDPGAVEVYTGSGANFTLRQSLSDASYFERTNSDQVGESVALSANGSVLLAGAPGTPTDGLGQNAMGVGFVFSSANAWGTVTGPSVIALGPVPATAVPPRNASLGAGVALNSAGTLALLGAPSFGEHAGDNVPPGGAAYVFAASGTSWTLQSTITSADAAAGDQFGAKVAFSGDGSTALIGAPQKASGTNSLAGAAYLFSAPGAAWGATGPATAVEYTNGLANNNLGFGVNLSADGTTAGIGALGFNGNAGIAYAFGIGAAASGGGGSTGGGGGSTGGGSGGGGSSPSPTTTTTTPPPAPLIVPIQVHLFSLTVRLAPRTVHVHHNQVYALHLTLKGAKGNPHGKVLVKFGKKTECSGSIAKTGKVTCKIAAKKLALGRHVLHVTFAGTPTYASFSRNLVFVVLK